MTTRALNREAAGRAGPAAVAGGLVLLALASVLRGGDYFVALIPIEIASLWVLLALTLRATPPPATALPAFEPLVAALLAAPLALALVQLTPIPAAWWELLPGHARLAQASRAAGIPDTAWRPLSIAPDATRASLLAGIPLVAAFLLGHLATLRQLRTLLYAVAAVAFGEVLLALLQLSGGERSPFYFGFMTYGSPIGSLGTRNEYANLLGMALAAYIWLAYDATRYTLRLPPAAGRPSGRFDIRHALAAWATGALVLVLGILISHSRAGAVFGLGAALLALAAAGLRVFGWSRGWRFAGPLAAVLLIAAIMLVGADAVTARLADGQLGRSADFRRELWASSWQAAWAFFPFGSGWGTFDLAYRPFQPPSIAGYANHAHMDPLEMFLEGGVPFLLFGACFVALAVRRMSWLLRTARRERALDREAMLAALCGIGLLGFLAHALVDFPMRVPANAIIAALLAGAFLRPLGGRRASDGAVVQ